MKSLPKLEKASKLITKEVKPVAKSKKIIEVPLETKSVPQAIKSEVPPAKSTLQQAPAKVVTPAQKVQNQEKKLPVLKKQPVVQKAPSCPKTECPKCVSEKPKCPPESPLVELAENGHQFKIQPDPDAPETIDF